MTKQTSSHNVIARDTARNLATDPSSQKGIFKYQALFDSNMMGVVSTNFQDTIISANDAFLSMIGYTQEDIDNGTLRWSTISPSKYNDTDDEKINELLANKSIVPFEKEYLHKDGRTVSVLVGAEAINVDLSYGVCFAVDISAMKELEQKKDDFISMVSHELKTPLSIMKLYTDFLENSIKTEASTKELLESTNEIRNQIDKLGVLISDLFNIARYKDGNAVSTMSAVNLHDRVKDVLSELSLINDRTIVFQCEKAIYVTGDSDRLAQVVINLVNNAIRYSNAETDIIVRVYKQDDCACVEVEDFGMGISEANLEKIFQRHYRVNHADDYTNEGAGVGLYICSEIVKQHKGKISVSSKIGSGSRFTVELPLIT